MDFSKTEMDVDEQAREPRKKPRKADGEAAMAGVEAAASAARSAAFEEELESDMKTSEDWLKMSEDWLKRIATPLTSEQLRQREEDLEKLLHGTWEMFRDNWIYGSIIPFDAVSKQLPQTIYDSAAFQLCCLRPSTTTLLAPD
jgi:hypothetical protein